MKLRKLVVVMILFSVAFVSVTTSSTQAQDQPEPKLEQLTAEQYDMPLVSLNGKIKTTVGQLSQGKIVFINFWAYWCPPCQNELPSLARLYQKFKSDPDVVFLFIAIESVDSGKSLELQKKDHDIFIANTKKILAGTGIHSQVYLTNTSEFQVRFFGRSIPTTYITDRNGKVVVSEIGEYDWNTREIHEALKTGNIQ